MDKAEKRVCRFLLHYYSFDKNNYNDTLSCKDQYRFWVRFAGKALKLEKVGSIFKVLIRVYPYHP